MSRHTTCTVGLIPLLLSIVLLPAPAACPDDLTGKVVATTGGGTITVLIDQQPVKVRLAEIDTPERGQPWSSRAKQALSEKVFGKEVELEVVDTDRSGRTVAHIYLGDRHIDRKMVREGHAWAYRKYLRDESLLEDEAAARKAGVGFWGIPEARSLPPWAYRAGQRAAVPADAGAHQGLGCGAKRYCREMESCEEALFYLEKCGVTRLDGDGDGVPCEKLCR
jgi:endonuclease YncB( thermonuclease family)